MLSWHHVWGLWWPYLTLKISKMFLKPIQCNMYLMTQNEPTGMTDYCWSTWSHEVLQHNGYLSMKCSGGPEKPTHVTLLWNQLQSCWQLGSIAWWDLWHIQAHKTFCIKNERFSEQITKNKETKIKLFFIWIFLNWYEQQNLKMI